MNARLRSRLRAAALALAAGTAAAGAAAQTGPQACGNPFQNHYGPFDYRAASATVRKIVEEVHFTIGVETITRPATTMFHDMAQDVQYTLNVFPNHHRALITMSRLADRWQRDPPPGTKLPVECWFDRAVRFRPDDTVARSLYAQWLHKRKRGPEGVQQLKVAVEHAKDNPLSHYNIGLVAMEIGDHALALQQAHKAQALGYPRPELADALKRVGRWVEPAAPPPGDAASSPDNAEAAGAAASAASAPVIAPPSS